MEVEEFRDIVGYEGLYQISNLGRVKSLERYDEVGRLLNEKILKNNLDIKGYYRIELSKDNIRKQSKIHKLLYNTFVCEYDIRYFEIDHINRIKTDNRLENLRVVSFRNNMNNRSDQSDLGVGVSKKINNKYQTLILINNNRIHLGVFETPLQASNKYQEIKKQIEEIEKLTRNYDFKRTKIGKEYFIEFFPL